jgi:modulator of FtsH protease
MAYDPSAWTDLLVACAGAGAALAGLVFVAVSINVEQILRYEGLPSRALATLVLLLGVVVVSIVGLTPGQSRSALGVELAVVGLLTAVAAGFMTARRQSGDRSGASARWMRLLLTAAGTVPLAIGGVSLAAGGGGGLYWVLGGIVFAIVGAVLNAWVLLVEIRR